MSLTIQSSIKTYPKLPYKKMLEIILGKKYDLSLVFIGTVRAQKMNKKYRNASYIPNVLSFPLSDTVGEIYITPSMAQKECAKRTMTHEAYIGFLFIHGLLHLKGYMHGDTMDITERKYLKYFKFA